MSDTSTAVPRADGHHGLRRSLGFRDLVVYGLLFIAPMAPVGVFGTLDARSHGAVALVYLIATVAMAFTAFSYAQMVRVVPQAGSVFAYARVALGNEAGFVAGWMALLTPVPSAELAADPARQGSAFYDAVNTSVGSWLHDLVAVSKAIGAAFAALAGQAAAGRLLFAMGRDRRLPRALSRTDGGVPRVALLCAAVITLVAAVWAARRDDGMDHLVSVVDIGALTAFTLLHASVLAWFAVRPRWRWGSPLVERSRELGGGPVSWWRHVLVPVLGAAITVAVIVEASGAAQVVGAVWLVAGLVVLAVQRGRRGSGEAG
ncbi:amino acid permease [Streptomyces pharetrae]|uniref:amino acid permease n=1 Tax=Streptomyces pharetrae TaxID=291370 RepID=UPI0036481BB7